MGAPIHEKVVAVVGAGDLVSHVRRREIKAEQPEYRFNIFRFRTDGDVTHGLRPSDLRDLVKLSQVVAFAVADDGWLSKELRQDLIELEGRLDEMTHTWSRATYDGQIGT